MAITSTVEYCTDRDVQDINPNIGSFDLKRRVYNWTTTDTSNQYQSNNVGLITQLYFDGIEGTSVSDSPNADYEYNYSSSTDSVQVFHSSKSPSDMIMEAGDDWVTVKTRFRRKASRLIESYLDSRMSAELQKDREGNYPEIIVRATAIQTSLLLVKAHDPNNETIEPLQLELNEIREGLRSGTITLPNTITYDSSKGFIREVSVNASTTLRPVELKGKYGYGGVSYDLLKVVVSTAGAIGTAKMDVYAKDSTKLKNDKIVDAEIITGDYQQIISNLYIRWWAGVIDGSTDVATVNDEYEIELYSSNLKPTMSQIGSLRMTRT